MKKSNKVLAFIPARGGSKRLPRKNIQNFAGRPLIYYSIALARAIQEIEWVVVSTDDDESASISESLGAMVIKRPPELSTDHSTTGVAAQHTLMELKRKGLRPDLVLTLQPNCPLRTVSLVREAFDLFVSGSVDSVISVSESKRKEGEIHEGVFIPQYKLGSRSQDLPKRYYENGLFYVTDARLIEERADIFGNRICPLIVDELFAAGDIDTKLDFEITEFLFLRYRELFQF